MAFTADELANIANAALDFYVRGETFKQTIQDKPLLKALESNKTAFPGGKGNISIPVQGDFVNSDANFFQGYTHNDTVTYANPANIKRAAYAWKELHAGISFTLTELKIDGISVVDSTTGKDTSEHSQRDLTVLTGLLENKMQDMGESWAREKNRMFWQDGTQDAKEIPGIGALISTTPHTGSTGGIDRATVTWWRNKAYVGVGTNADGAAITASPTNQTATLFLRTLVRQLRRYATNPKWLILGGSGAIEKLESEVQAKGTYTLNNFTKQSATDIAMADISISGIGTIMYDPTLDDLSKSNFLYFIDLNAIKFMPMTGEENKTHNPARPPSQYVLYRAITTTGGLVARQLNTSAVVELA